MSVTIAPKWKMQIGQYLFGVGIIFAALGWGSLFFGYSNTFATISLTIGVIPLILSIILIRKNLKKIITDHQY